MQLFNFFRHYFLAKRRHGIHSPFVFGFSEQVLKANKYNIKFNTDINIHKSIEAAIVYINPEQITLDGTSITKQSEFIYKYNHEKTSFSKHLLLTTIDNELLFSGHSFQDCIIIFRNRNNKTNNKWRKLYQKECYKMILDNWHFGVLLQNHKFKSRQLFLLK